MRGAATQAMPVCIVEERQQSRCPPAAAPLRAAARRPAGGVARSLHTAPGMLVARALPAGLGASSKMYTLFPDGPLVHDFINTERIPPQRGERKLAGGERSEPPGRRGTRYAPRQGLQDLLAPLPRRVGHVGTVPGVRKKRSPLAKFLPLLIVVLQPLLAAEPQSRIETQFF